MLNRRHRSRYAHLALATFALVCGIPATAQTGPPAAATRPSTMIIAPPATVPPAAAAAGASNAPDSRDIEAQRRLVMSRRRKEKILQDAQYNLTLTTPALTADSEPAPHRGHRGAAMHRTTTSEGRHAALRPPSPTESAIGAPSNRGTPN